MKVCIPAGNDNCMEGIVEKHFGKAPTYTIKDPDTGNVYVITNESITWGRGIAS